MRWTDKPYYLYILALLSGFLLWLGWPTKPLAPILLIAFVPLLIIEDYLANSTFKRRGLKFFGYTYITMVVWNVLTTYWIYNATPGGGIFAMTCNALFMCFPFLMFFHTKKLTSPLLGYISLISYWIAFEYLHLNWDLSWPWLTLGNGFASVPPLVQWYEYTGVFGGTLWILALNVLCFIIFKERANKDLRKKIISLASGLLFIPILISLSIYNTYEDQGKEVEVVVVQPNIDPYREKFRGTENFIPYEKQLERLLTLSEKGITPDTRYLAWPETAMPFDFIEGELENDPYIEQLRQFLQRHPHVTMITGIDYWKHYQTGATASKEERKTEYEAFNSALQINKDKELYIYHKSKLVPGVEYMPPALSSLAIAMGESAYGLGRQKERTVFFNNEKTGVAPVICYESIFGEFVTEYVKKGANMIFIITNDAWWGNTQGHKQHIQYASLRAIETRKSIARSANTGISGFINQRGDIVAKSKYATIDVMRMKIKENNIQTFYTKYGDFIGKAGGLAALAAFIVTMVIGIKRRKSVK